MIFQKYSTSRRGEVKHKICRLLAQPGSASGLGPEGQRFESSITDHFFSYPLFNLQ